MKTNRTFLAAAAIALLANLPSAVLAQTPNMMPMMGATQPGMMPGMMGGFGMDLTDHVEGRIAFLKAELKITDAQTAPWNAFADTLRANAKKFGDARQSMMKPGAARASFAESLDIQERLLSARLDGTRSLKASFAALVPKLSDEQKKTADDLLAPQFGMRMMAMGQMGQSAQ